MTKPTNNSHNHDFMKTDKNDLSNDIFLLFGETSLRLFRYTKQTITKFEASPGKERDREKNYFVF